ncbi:Hypothetical_protein [Hexamita inflata]|uniref:Hypothetical_protein n=1 Tax=Hexamita inflata TaxID=28002 RepID=A0AA86QDW0_9EUKA|nr:Hypothetical protein HINF_LOCUS25153 [Hexamita inflata]CAI9957361.1 Hypothetical protein HINF_LOCUS45006 [Hexamita inflata]
MHQLLKKQKGCMHQRTSFIFQANYNSSKHNPQTIFNGAHIPHQVISVPILVTSTLFLPVLFILLTQTQKLLILIMIGDKILDIMYPLQLLRIKLLPLNLQSIVVIFSYVLFTKFTMPDAQSLVNLNYINDPSKNTQLSEYSKTPEIYYPDAIKINQQLIMRTSQTIQSRAPYNTFKLKVMLICESVITQLFYVNPNMENQFLSKLQIIEFIFVCYVLLVQMNNQTLLDCYDKKMSLFMFILFIFGIFQQNVN